MSDRIQFRRDTAERWAQFNPFLLEGEIGVVLDNPNQYKVGDGVHYWNDLPLRGFNGNIVNQKGQSEDSVMSQKAVTDAINSNTAYLYCTSNAGDNKVVQNTGFDINNGIRLLIKMQYANTKASDVTLQVGTTDAKPIIYNGSAVTDENTWDANDVLDVYYDGNNYQACLYSIAQFATGEKVKNVGIDNEPTAGSENLVKSGGVYEKVDELGQEVKNDESIVQEMAVQLFTGVGIEDMTLSPINLYDGQKTLLVNGNGKAYLGDVQGDTYYVYVYDLANVESKLNITGSGNWSVAYFAFFTSSLFDAASNVGEVNLAPSGPTTQKKTFYNVDIPSGAQYLLVQELHYGQLIGQKVTKQVAPSQIISGADVYNFMQRKFLRVDAAQAFSSSEKKQGLDNLGIIDSNFYLLEYYGNVAGQMQALSLGAYFFNTYNNTLNQKTAEAGTAGYKIVPIKKDDLCYYLGRFYTSLDGNSLTDIGHGSFHVIEYWGKDASYIATLNVGTYFFNTYDNTLNIKNVAAGTYGATGVPLSKNDLYYYGGKLYVSLDESTLTDISTIIQNNYIVQGTGSDTGKVMSQKAVTDTIALINNYVRNLFFDDNSSAVELDGQKIENAYFNSTGAQVSHTSFDIYLYDIQSISVNLRIVSYTNWGQPLYAFYSDDELSAETLVQMGTSGAASTEITIDNLTIPTEAKYLAVNFHRQYGKTAHAYKLIKVINNPINNSLRGKKWACVGDSLTEVNSRTTKHYFDFVAEELGVIPLNYGVSGTGYARHREDNIAFYQRISSIDLSADIITIFGSFNDLGTISQDFPIGNITDTGTNSVAGCINTTIDNIQARFPLARLGIISPTPWNNTHPGDAGNSTNYVNIIRDICEYRSIPFLDLWRCSNLRPWDATFREMAYSKDEGNGVHPDEKGHSLIAPKFRQFIKNLM